MITKHPPGRIIKDPRQVMADAMAGRPAARPEPPQQTSVHPSQTNGAVPPARARPGNATRADYPRMLYDSEGRTLVVASPEEHDAKMKEGWDTVPPPAFHRPKATQSPVTSGSVDELRQIIRQTLESVLDERGFRKRSS